MTTRYIIRALIIIAALTATFATRARSADEINFADTTLERNGGTYFVPAFGKLETAGDSLEITIEFNALQLDLRSVRAGQGYLLSEQKFTTDLSNPIKARAIIRSKNFTPGAGSLFDLELEPLAFQDSISNVTPISLKINGADVSAGFRNGLIRIKNPIAVEFFEGLGFNSPNPFFQSTKFRFSIESETKVKFKVFSAAGFSPGASKLDKKIYDYSITDSEGNAISDPEDYSFKRGIYYLALTPKKWELASGAYLLMMETSRGTYLKNFIYEK